MVFSQVLEAVTSISVVFRRIFLPFVLVIKITILTEIKGEDKSELMFKLFPQKSKSFHCTLLCNLYISWDHEIRAILRYNQRLDAVQLAHAHKVNINCILDMLGRSWMLTIFCWRRQNGTECVCNIILYNCRSKSRKSQPPLSIPKLERKKKQHTYGRQFWWWQQTNECHTQKGSDPKFLG